MEVLKFTLSGRGATFTRPFCNNLFYTYAHIHKIALLGILGAIIGIEKAQNVGMPEFYSKLNMFEIAIVPSKPDFPSKFFNFTETSGMFNKAGSTYIAKYEMLVKPSWDIYVVSRNCDLYQKIKEYILNRQYYYVPYLGKNHYFARITEPKVLTGEYVVNCNSINSLFIEEDIQHEPPELSDDPEIYFEDVLPVLLKDVTFQYEERIVAFTNDEVLAVNKPVLKCEGKYLYLF